MFRIWSKTSLIVVLFLILLTAVGCLPEQDGGGVPTPTTGAQDTAVVVTENSPTEAVPVESSPTDTEAPSPTATAEPTATNTPEPTPTPTPIAIGPADFPANVNPLTGLQVSDPSLLDRAPVLVKVANFPRGSRPHSGLSAADMVFEYTIGEGSTRFTALYYGKDVEKVGPVRSARLIDIPLTTAYQGILGYVGADEFVFNRLDIALGNRAIHETPNTCPAICRLDPAILNGVFANTASLTDYAETAFGIAQTRPDLSGMRFEGLVPAGGKPGEWLQVQYTFYTRSEWRFDSATGRYLRWIEAVDDASNVTMVELIDRETGQQLAFDNVVVMYAQHNELKPTLHEMIMLGNTTGQRALLFRNGQVYDLTWKYPGSGKPFQFFTADGQLAPFKPGTTWFEVVGLYTTAEEIAAGQWEVKFYMP